MSADVAASVKARLLANARAEGEEFQHTLTRFAAERFLYRLGASKAGERCLLKGATLLTAWLRDPYRATRDIDVLAFGPDDDAAIRALIEEICAVRCAEDALQFDPSGMTVEPIRAEEEYSGHRARFIAFLGKARIQMQVDVGFGDALSQQPEEIDFPTMLPGLQAPRLRGYPREASVAEKFEAMVKLDIRNSRMKDFHDVWALSSAFTFDGPRLQNAVSACFERRATPWRSEVPRALTPAFYQMTELATRWNSYLTAGAVLVPPPAQFDVIGERIIGFLGPIRANIIADVPFPRTWERGGPWSETRNEEPA